MSDTDILGREMPPITPELELLLVGASQALEQAMHSLDRAVSELEHVRTRFYYTHDLKGVRQLLRDDKTANPLIALAHVRRVLNMLEIKEPPRTPRRTIRKSPQA